MKTLMMKQEEYQMILGNVESSYGALLRDEYMENTKGAKTLRI